jgi:hypothetical protein
VGSKCHWAESGPVGSAQLAQGPEVQERTLISCARHCWAVEGLLGLYGPNPCRRPVKGLSPTPLLHRPPGVRWNARCLLAAAARTPGPGLGLPQPGCDAARRTGPRRSAGVRWLGSRVCTRPRARCTTLLPGSRGCARRCRRGESRRFVLVTAAARSGRSPANSQQPNCVAMASSG